MSVGSRERTPRLVQERDRGADGLRFAWTDDYGFTDRYAVAESERQIRAAGCLNRLRLPPEELLVEQPRVPEVAGVQLYMDDFACLRNLHPLLTTRELAQTHRPMSS